MQMTQANMMDSSTDTRNILSKKNDSTPKEKGDSEARKLPSKNSSRNTSPKAAAVAPAAAPVTPVAAPVAAHGDVQPKKALDKKGTIEKQSRAPSRNGKGSAPTPVTGRVNRTPTRNGSRGTTPSPIQIRSATQSHASPDELVVRRTQGAHVHLRSARHPGCEGQQSTQARTAREVHKSGDHVSSRRENEVLKTGEHISPRENEVHNSGEHVSPQEIEVHNNGGHVSLRETENIRPRSSNAPDSEGPRRSSSCNCGGRKCLHESSQDHGKDHAFMDGFETKEQPWKPGKKVADHLTDQPRSEYRWKSSRKSIPGADRMQSRNPEWRSEDPPVSRKGTGGRDGGAAQVQREYDPYGNPLNVPEWEWHPGKGRGNGPVPGEWLPPFRGYSTRAESEPPPFLKGKGSGRRHSDEWLPPFRVVDRPASWHRSKGAGSGPPPDQWSPPWGQESTPDAERGGGDIAAGSGGRKHTPAPPPASCPV